MDCESVVWAIPSCAEGEVLGVVVAIMMGVVGYRESEFVIVVAWEGMAVAAHFGGLMRKSACCKKTLLFRSVLDYYYYYYYYYYYHTTCMGGRASEIVRMSLRPLTSLLHTCWCPIVACT